MKRVENRLVFWVTIGLVVSFALLGSAQISYASKELVKEAKGECFYQCQDTNTTGGGASTCSPANSTLAAVEKKFKDPTHIQCEQKACGTASYSGSGGSGQEDRCKKMPGMPPMLPMPMPKMPMPMPKQDDCMSPEKADTKECKCKKPENADSKECRGDKETDSTFEDILKPENEKEESDPKSIVDYGKDLFNKIFGNDKEEDAAGKELTAPPTTVTRVENRTTFDPSTATSLQPPLNPARPSLNNTPPVTTYTGGNPTNQASTFGNPTAAQDFETRAGSQQTQGLVSRIGSAAQAVINNIRNFFGL